MEIDEHLKRFTDRGMIGSVAASAKSDRPMQQKATEVLINEVAQIACGYDVIEQRLNEVLARFGGGSNAGEKEGTGPSTAFPTHFLGAMGSHASNLGLACQRISSLVDRLEELV